VKSVSLFDTGIGLVFSERGARNVRAGKVLFQLVTKTGKGINPAVLWLDAALAVSDCISAYLRYQQAKEITAQLEHQKETLDQQIKDFQEILDAEDALSQEEHQQRQQMLNDVLRRDKKAAQRLLKKIQSHRQTLDLLLMQLAMLRQQPRLRTPELNALVNSVDKLMQAQLACLITAFDESNP